LFCLGGGGTGEQDHQFGAAYSGYLGFAGCGGAQAVQDVAEHVFVDGAWSAGAAGGRHVDQDHGHVGAGGGAAPDGGGQGVAHAYSAE
jgi:hypothetical protein